MIHDPLIRLRRVDRYLALLNFLLAGMNLFFFFPYSAYVCLLDFRYGFLSRGIRDFLMTACDGALLLLHGAMWLIPGAVVIFLRAKPSNRTLTRILIVLAGCHFLLLAFIMVKGFFNVSLRFLGILPWRFWLSVLLDLLLFFGPSLLYCIAAAILLSIRNSIRPFDPIVTAETARFSRGPLGESQGIVQGNQFLGTTVERPTMKPQASTEHRQGD